MNDSFLKQKIKKYKNINFISGFTLVEFMVVIGIFIIFSGMMLTRYSGLKSSVSIETLSQDIAISVRKAQLYSVGVKETDSTLGKVFPPGYGVSFSPISSGNVKSYFIFADMNGDKTYTDVSGGTLCGIASLDSSNECLETITISSDDFVKEIYAVGSICNSNLDIVFSRPNLSASIKCGSTQVSQAKIKISNTEGQVKSIVVPTAGNIYVE